MKTQIKLFFVGAIIIFSAFVVLAEVRLPDILGDSMVLQQKQLVPIFGWADAGETVTVTFGKQKKTVVADANGKWRVDLKNLEAGFTPQILTIEGKNKIELKNILVGEVWLVAGQSNMQTAFARNGEWRGSSSCRKSSKHQTFQCEPRCRI